MTIVLNGLTGITTPDVSTDDGGVYAKGNILGTVAQSAGVPTGAIIQRGSNANGEFVRFADGTLICTGIVALTNLPTGGSAAVTTVPLPSTRLAISVQPAIAVTIDGTTTPWSSFADRGKYVFSARSTSTTEITILYYAIAGTNPTGGNGSVFYTMTTRWF